MIRKPTVSWKFKSNMVTLYKINHVKICQRCEVWGDYKAFEKCKPPCQQNNKDFEKGKPPCQQIYVLYASQVLKWSATCCVIEVTILFLSGGYKVESWNALREKLEVTSMINGVNHLESMKKVRISDALTFYIGDHDLMVIFNFYVNLGTKNFLISLLLGQFALVNRD